MTMLERLGRMGGRLVPWRPTQVRANPVGALLSDVFQQRVGLGHDWAPAAYGDYRAISPAVFACVNIKARNLSRLRMQVHQAQPTGDVLPVPDAHPAQRLLDHVNAFWSRQRFWYMVSASLGLWGSAPVALFRDGRGQGRELWWLRPDRFKVVPDPVGYIKGYIYSRDGLDVSFAPGEVLWFRYPNPIQEYAGLSPIAALRMTIDMNVDAIRFNRRFFQNDATPGRTYIKTDRDLTGAQAESLRQRWEKAFKNRDKAHSIAVLDRSAELRSLSISQRDMEFIEAQRFTKEEICAAYGVPPVLLGDLGNATFSNYQQAKTSFWDETLIPELQLIESEVQKSLLPQLGGEGLTVRFDLTEVTALREDATAKAKRHQTLVQSGILTINEVRQREGLAPVPWGDTWNR